MEVFSCPLQNWSPLTFSQSILCILFIKELPVYLFPLHLPPLPISCKARIIFSLIVYHHGLGKTLSHSNTQKIFIQLVNKSVNEWIPWSQENSIEFYAWFCHFLDGFSWKSFHYTSLKLDRVSGFFQVYNLQIHLIEECKSTQMFRADNLKGLAR